MATSKIPVRGVRLVEIPNSILSWNSGSACFSGSYNPFNYGLTKVICHIASGLTTSGSIFTCNTKENSDHTISIRVYGWSPRIAQNIDEEFIDLFKVYAVGY